MNQAIAAKKNSYNEPFRNMTQSISNGDSVTRFGDTGHVTLTIENMP